MKHQYRFRWKYSAHRKRKGTAKAIKPSKYFEELAREGAGFNVGR